MSAPSTLADASAESLAAILDTARAVGWHAHIDGAAGFPHVVLMRPTLDAPAPAHLLFVDVSETLDDERRRWGERLIASGARWYHVPRRELSSFLVLLVDLAVLR